MKSLTAIAALIAVAAFASNAFAQSGVPGGSPSKPNKVTAVPPPPPPPRGPDKFATQTQPPKPGADLRKPRVPTVVDDYAGDPKWQGSTCHPGAGPNCVPSLDKLCTERGGGMNTNPDGSVTCTVN